MGRLVIGLFSGMLILSLVSGPSSAEPAIAAPPRVGEFTTFELGNAGYGGNALAAGPDGNMWFTNTAKNAIGVITGKGAVTYFPVPTEPRQGSNESMGSGLFGLTAGPDGNMWFTGFYQDVIGNVTPSGVVTLYRVPLANSRPYGITAGVDGNLWFTLDAANGIGRITPDGVITLFPIPTPGVDGITVNTSDCVMCGYLITAGPQDSLWFTIPAANMIGRITVQGVVTTFPVEPGPAPSAATGYSGPLVSLTTGADGRIYYARNTASKIGAMTVNGVETNYALPAGAAPTMITAAPNGTLWISEPGLSSLGSLSTRVRPSITQFPIPTPNSVPGAGAIGPDGNLWYVNVIEGSTGNTLQVGYVSTGLEPLLTAKVTGQPKVGSKLICAKRENDSWPSTMTRYHWLRNGRVIPTERRKSFTPTGRDAGVRISCRVSQTYAPNLNQLGANSTSVTIER